MKTMRKVEGSSSIASYEYDDETSTLTIEFKSGTKYDYYDVNSSLIDNFHTAESKGKFFAANIRDKFHVDVVEESIYKDGIANPTKVMWPFPTCDKP
jgi:hypothetical protein